MEAALKSQVLTKLEQLPKGRIIEVLDFIEFILAKSSSQSLKVAEASDQEVLRAIEASGSLDFYYNESQNVYTLLDGEPI